MGCSLSLNFTAMYHLCAMILFFSFHFLYLSFFCFYQERKSNDVSLLMKSKRKKKKFFFLTSIENEIVVYYIIIWGKHVTESASGLAIYREADEHIEKVDGAMEWNFKEFFWESSDLEQKEDGDLGAVVEFGRFESQKKKVESLVDLKLTVADSKDGSLIKLKDGKESKDPILISPRSSKRKNGIRRLSCLVDSCKADMSKCGHYYLRHRVCECHSKTPIVTIKGEEKRFCQQCSRFHCLGEFDLVKRSCRKRLDGHNRRRRKTQPEPFYSSSTNFMSTYKGPRIPQFGPTHIHASPTMGNMWALNAKTEANPSIYNHVDRFHTVDEQRSAPNSFNGGNKLCVVQANDTKHCKTSGSSLCQPALDPITLQVRGRGSHLLPSETVTLPVELGGCALYLLSINSTQAAPEMSLSNHLVQSNEAHTIQFQDSAGPNNSLANLAEYPSANEQAWESNINF